MGENTKVVGFVVDAGRWEAVYEDEKGQKWVAPVVGFATRESSDGETEIIAMTFADWCPGGAASCADLVPVDEVTSPGEYLCIQATLQAARDKDPS
jgi:hypothetical protein